MTANGRAYDPVSIGVIGCGTIASAIITGLIKTQRDLQNNSSIPAISSISLSKRSEKKSSALKEAHPELITVYENNQDILDKADIIFLCVLNNQTQNVLEPLQFDTSKHTLISLVVSKNVFFANLMSVLMCLAQPG